MRVSNNHSFIFLSNPRCASSSLDAALQEYSAFGHEHCASQANAKLYNANDMRDYFAYMDENDEESWAWENYYKFTTIRNPFTRWVSYYFFIKPDKEGRPDYAEEYDYSSQFAMGFGSWVEFMINNDHGLPNYEYFCLDHETKENLVDKVIKVEELDSEFPVFMKSQFNIEISETPKLDFNMSQVSTPVVDPYSLYNQKTRDLVEQVYESDIQAFNYEFGQ